MIAMTAFLFLMFTGASVVPGWALLGYTTLLSDFPFVMLPVTLVGGCVAAVTGRRRAS